MRALRYMLTLLLAVAPLALGGCGLFHNTLTAKADPFAPIVPMGANVNAIQILSPADGWAVGGVLYETQTNGTPVITSKQGALLSYNGASWYAYRYPQALLGISLNSRTSGWAVGADGAIAHFDGVAWTPQVSGVTTLLYGVAAVSDTEAWAVGAAGTLLHYTAGAWQSVAAPVASTLRAISMVSAQEGWAAGDGGTVIHYLNGTWSVATVPAAFTLRSIAILGPHDVWFGGGDTVNGSSGSATLDVLRDHAGTWTTEAADVGVINALAASGPQDVWATGTGGETHYDGTGWTYQQDTRYANQPNLPVGAGVAAADYAGTLFLSFFPAMIYRGSGTTFTKVYQAPTCGLNVAFFC